LAIVVREASMIPLNCMLAQGFDMMEIVQKKDHLKVPITMDHFTEALKSTSRSVNQDQLKEYEEWMKQFGST
jgi:SpoVK/Ycf46/Vps4 family AAA+-type ATPase